MAQKSQQQSVVVASLFSLVLLTGCQADTVTYACPTSCIAQAFATFELACSPNDLTAVVATGPCAMPDAGLSYYTGTTSELTVAVGSPEAGACHVELQFATGFTYSQDVTFTSQPDPSPSGCAPCPSFIGPTGGPWTVSNPNETCVALPEAAVGEASDASAVGDATAPSEAGATGEAGGADASGE